MILPHIIERIMVTAFYPKGVIGLNRLDEDDLEQIPILRQVVCLCRFIFDNNCDMEKDLIKILIAEYRSIYIYRIPGRFGH